MLDNDVRPFGKSMRHPKEMDVSLLNEIRLNREAGPDVESSEGAAAGEIVLSFDVEEHYRIEAAAGISIDPGLKTHYRDRLDYSTRWLLERLAQANVSATFFFVGEIARHNPSLVRAVAVAGHEVASHGWDHRRVHHFNAETFQLDVRRSQETLEDVAGKPVMGYRAPTFSIGSQTAWALDVLAELGMAYDSSIYSVRHDRYGVPGAPRSPFLARGERHAILELPPATLRLFGMNFPMGGGGYFRLFPLFMTRWAIRQTARDCSPSVVTLYFHPWEFDRDQKRLPLGLLNRFRTYVGLHRTCGRLDDLLERFRFVRAVDLAKRLEQRRHALASFNVAPTVCSSPEDPSNLRA
jgi:polysaccharide deacetylase family protein (PEP-CTERM system associated)